MPQRCADRSPRDGAAIASNKRRQSRRNQIDEIVEPRRRPAKRLIALGAMPDHGVGGVDGLVGDQSGQPQQRQPEHRRHHAVGKILGAGFDRGPAYAGFVQLFGIASDDHRDRFPRAGEPAFGERRAHRGDMLVEASLRDEDRGDQREDDIAHRKLLHDRIESARRRRPRSATRMAVLAIPAGFALLRRLVFAIELAVEHVRSRPRSGSPDVPPAARAIRGRRSVRRTPGPR